MRTSPLLLALLLVIALFVSACGGPKNDQKQLAEACERQLKEVEEAHDSGDTPSAPSSDARDEAETLVECAGQAPAAPVEAAAGEGDEADAGEAPEGDAAMVPTADDLDPAARELFIASCASCHVLSDADATGAVGPNLDESTSTAEEITTQIINGGGAMPPALLEGEDATAVGEYVAAAAAIAAAS